MKTTLVVAVLALVLAGNAMGSSKHHSTWKSMTEHERLAVANHAIAVHRPPVRAWIHHHFRVPESSAAPMIRCRAIGVRAPGAICVHAQHLVHALRIRAIIDAKLAPARPKLPTNLVSAFTCIHHHEGAWNANTGNGYYGGLQMDFGFMSTYGGEYVRRWGTADNWPTWAQLQAAIRAYESGRGFSPWPNTARACGLL